MEHIHRSRVGIFIFYFLFLSTVYASTNYGKTTMNFMIGERRIEVEPCQEIKKIDDDRICITKNGEVIRVNMEECIEILKIGKNKLCIKKDKTGVLIISSSLTVLGLVFPKKERRFNYEKDINNVISVFADANGYCRNNENLY